MNTSTSGVGDAASIFSEIMRSVAMIPSLPPLRRFSRIIAHPDHAKSLSVIEGHGIPVVADKNVPKYASKYCWPKTRFIEYEDSDIAWGKYAGVGSYVEDKNQPVVWAVNEPKYPNPLFYYGAAEE